MASKKSSKSASAKPTGKVVSAKKTAENPTARSALPSVATKAAKPAAADAKAPSKAAAKKSSAPVASSGPASKPIAKAGATSTVKSVDSKVTALPGSDTKTASHGAAATGKIAKMTSASKASASPGTPGKATPKASEKKASSGTALTEESIRVAPASDYMNEDQLNFFRERLLQMRAEVLAREIDVKERLHQREVFADPADRASAEEEHWLDLRLRERESLLLRKIEEAFKRIRDKEYGYCEKTGEAIGIARLLARPTATVCVDVKGQDERAESQYRDR